jgi:RND family efflux transporter MFP subunit
MRVWKQLVLGAFFLAASAATAARFVPGADALLVNAGVPQGIVAVLAPSEGSGQSIAATPPPGQGAQRQASQRQGGPAGGSGRGAQQVLVTAAPVAFGVVNDKLDSIGDGQAVNSITVMPSVTGTLASVEVKSGQRLNAGDVLARLDDSSDKIAVNSAKLALASAEEKLARYRGLRTSVSRVETEDARRGVEEAKLALQTAELDLSRRVISAPIGGVAGIVAISPGDNVTTQTKIVDIDDRSEILVDFWVPERFVGVVAVGAAVEASAIAQPGKLYKGTVAAIDSRIDVASRTIRVRAQIPNVNDALRAGMSFAVSMRFDGDRYPAVDPLSVQWDSKGSYVWRLKEGKAERVPVKIVQRNPEYVLVDGKLVEGDSIVSEGMQRVRPGLAVTVANATGGNQS